MIEIAVVAAVFLINLGLYLMARPSIRERRNRRAMRSWVLSQARAEEAESELERARR